MMLKEGNTDRCALRIDLTTYHLSSTILIFYVILMMKIAPPHLQSKQTILCIHALLAE